MTTSRAVEAKKHAYRQTQDGIVISFVLHPNDVTSSLATAPLGTRYACAFVEIGDDELPINREEVVPDKGRAPQTELKTRAGEKRSWSSLPPAQQAGIRANEKAFWSFLSETNLEDKDNLEPFVTNEADAANYIRLICLVSSRAELNTINSAAARWRDLDARFQAWLTAPVPA